MSLPTVLIDSREQAPWTFPEDVEVQTASLRTGDYSLSGLQELVSVERKELSDLCACVGRDRDRMKAELHRLAAYRARGLIVEAELSTIMAGDYRSKIEPQCILGSLASWSTRYGVPVWFVGDHGADVCLAVLRTFYEQCKQFAKSLEVS